MTMPPDRSTPTLTDSAIATMFERRARRAEATDLRGQILAATSSLHQEGARSWRLWTVVRPGPVRALGVMFIVLTLVALALAGVGALRSDRPAKLTTTEFVPRFEYLLPPASDLRPAAGDQQGRIIAWISGAEPRSTAFDSQLYGDQEPETGSLRGIIVAAGESPWTHTSTGRERLRTEPSELLDDLRTNADVPLSATTRTSLDGHRAVTATLAPTANNDIHVTGSADGGLTGGQGFILLNSPGVLTVADVDGTTVIVLIWARTVSDLDAWLPVANQFVASIHFLPEANR